MHQLAAPRALRPRLVAGLPRRRADRRRRPHSRVRLRARHRQRAARDQGASDRLPGRGRQRLRDLERLRQPLLAGAVLRRPRRRHPRPPLRRRTLRELERVIQQLLGAERELVSVEGRGVEAAADWDHLRTPETYLGYARSDQFASPPGPALDHSREYTLPERLRLNHWALAGTWTFRPEYIVLDQAAGSLDFRFHARDAHLVLSPGAREPIPFRVLLDGKAPGPSHGVDVDAEGNGALRDGRMYQLCASTTRSVSGSWRSRSSSPAPRRTRSRSDSARRSQQENTHVTHARNLATPRRWGGLS